MHTKSTSNKLNWLINLGVFLNAFIVIGLLFQGASYRLSVSFFTVALILWAVSVGGMFLIHFTDKAKLGSILIIVGAAIFVPLGLIAILGAVRVQDELKRRAFESNVRLVQNQS